MSMSDDNEESQNASKSSGKETKHFVVLTVLILILGTTLIFTILQFRSKSTDSSDSRVSIQKDLIKLKPQTKSLIKKAIETRRPSTGRSQNKKLQGKPFKYLRNRNQKSFKTHPRSAFVISKESIKLGRSGEYEIIEDYAAVSSEFSDRFDSSDVIGEKLRRLFVKKAETKGLNSEQIVRNTRTGQIGIVTGVLVVTFRDEQSFEERENLIPTSFNENRIFKGIKTAIWSGDQVRDLQELSALQMKLLTDSRLKKVKVEILENDRVSK